MPRAGLSAERTMLGAALMRPWGPAVWNSYSARLWPGLPDSQQRAARLTGLLRRPGRWRAFWATTRTDHRVVSPWLDKVDCPALVVMGQEDPDWKDPAAEAAWVASAVGGGGGEVVIVPGAGHAPMLERSGLVGPQVVDFARRMIADNAEARPAGGEVRSARCHEQG